MKEIFRDGWQVFKSRHPRYEGVDDIIQKMLGCGDVSNLEFVESCPYIHQPNSRHCLSYTLLHKKICITKVIDSLNLVSES
jgi:hypothetical protein